MSNILRTEIRTENLKCGVCGQTFQCTVKDDYFLGHCLGSSKPIEMCRRTYAPEKVCHLPDDWPLTWYCPDCWKAAQNQILVYWYDMDSPWTEAYVFKNLEKLYKDYPGQWFREKAAYIRPYSDKKIYRIF